MSSTILCLIIEWIDFGENVGYHIIPHTLESTHEIFSLKPLLVTEKEGYPLVMQKPANTPLLTRMFASALTIDPKTGAVRAERKSYEGPVLVTRKEEKTL